jgi:hypothetical protein
MNDNVRKALEKHLRFFEAIKEALGQDGVITADDFAVAAEDAGLVGILDHKNAWIDLLVAETALAEKAPSTTKE